MWNDIVNANCARANTTASQPWNMKTFRPHRCGTEFTMAKVAAVSPCLPALRGSAINVQQARDGAIDVLIPAFAVVMENNSAILIDDVLRRPILVAVSIPGL